MADRVVVIGAGLAGLAAAAALAARGFQVTLLECAADSAAGPAPSPTPPPASSSTPASTSAWAAAPTSPISAAPSASPISSKPNRRLYFMTPDRRVSPFAADRLPAPFHLARAFLRAHYLGLADKARIAWGLARLRLAAGRRRPALPRLAPPPRPDARAPSTASGASSSPAPSTSRPTASASATPARSSWTPSSATRRGFEVELPTVPLGRLYGDELLAWLDHHAVRLLLGQAARALRVRDDRVHGVELRDGEAVERRLVRRRRPLRPPARPAAAGRRRRPTPPSPACAIWRLRPSPASIYGTTGRSRPCRTSSSSIASASGCSTAARSRRANTMSRSSSAPPATFRGLGHDEVRRRIADGDWPGCSRPRPRRRCCARRVVTEHAATFSAVPGVDRWRPAQASPIPNLFLAGDWTATGWPATMEGAVRSGYLAAEAPARPAGQAGTDRATRPHVSGGGRRFFGPRNSAWRRFDRWSGKGTWRLVFELLRGPDLEWPILDSASCSSPCSFFIKPALLAARASRLTRPFRAGYFTASRHRLAATAQRCTDLP